MADDTRFVDETAAVAIATRRLLDMLAQRLPELATVLPCSRVVIDTRELTLLVCPIRSDGSSIPLLALRCDPDDTDTFGVLAIPVAARGAYGPPARMH
jgi:hypothetical protein